MAKRSLLARTLVELADTLVVDFDVVDLLSLLADRCVEVLDVDAAGLMLAGPEGGLRVIASSSEAMRVLELFELQAEEGPCLDCYRTGERVVNQDLTNSRVTIEQAKGMVAERLDLEMHDAFAKLRAYARNPNLRLVDVALGVVKGTLPIASLEQA